MALIVTKNGEISSSAAIDISAGVTGSLVVSSSYLILSESAAEPATPASSKGVLYASGSDGHVYWKDDAGNVFDLTRTSSARTDFGTSSIDPTSPTPVEGDIYYNTILEKEMRYDGSRAKWLSIEIDSFAFGSRGNTPIGSYFKGPDNVTFGAATGFPTYHSGTIIDMGITRDDTDAVVIQITSNGTELSFLSSSALLTTASLDDDFGPNEVLGARNKSPGNAVSNVAGWVKMKWRI